MIILASSKLFEARGREGERSRGQEVEKKGVLTDK